MNQHTSARQRLVYVTLSVALAALVGSNFAVAGVVRNFDSVPAGDVISGGAALTGPGAPGSPSSQMNNTAAPAWGNQAASYEGQYMVGNGNLTAELGTSSLSAFTLTYAYRPDIPNDPDTSARQLAIRPSTGNPGTEVLGIGLSARRQDVAINGVSVGLPPFFPAGRLMDGDPLTTSDPDVGPCCSNESEWVFYAMTYEVVIPTAAAQVKMYGMAASEAGAGLQEILNTTGYYGDNLNLTGLDLFLGNTGFGGGTVWRPADSSFDALTMDARVLSVSEIAALGRAVIFAVPEPSSMALVLVSCTAAAMVRSRRSWKSWGASCR